MNLTLTLTDIASDDDRKGIAAPLIQYNDAKAGASNYRTLVVTLKDEAGAVLGGLWGYTSYGWLFVQLLALPEALRGMGHGRQLMHAAEQEAIARGCRHAWLDTFEFQARGFYEKLGYVLFGELPDHPPGFARFFLKKQLIPDDPHAGH
jgi:GNAT superfamily N-acetyltransferase